MTDFAALKAAGAVAVSDDGRPVPHRGDDEAGAGRGRHPRGCRSCPIARICPLRPAASCMRGACPVLWECRGIHLAEAATAREIARRRDRLPGAYLPCQYKGERGAASGRPPPGRAGDGGRPRPIILP